MPKLLFNATDIARILENHPEVEAELTKTAADQIAESFKRKVLNQSSTLTDRLIAEINSKLNYKYHLPDVVIKVIKECADDHFKRITDADAEKRAKKAFDEAAARYVRDLPGRLDKLVTDIVEKKVNAVFAAATRLAR